MVVYIYKYGDNSNNRSPWSDPWLRNPRYNDYHAIRASADMDGTWTYVPHDCAKTSPDAAPVSTPDPRNPDSYWTNVPKQRYCCCKDK